ncbi:DUF2783 domain-containing protein [Lysobacter enzymogenes]|uniref:DUF2783 domain-containing protein n=1 Tax=Lysobacter enzymogenes TaxID=69 RepID=UPI00099C17C1|nr:DUF2783 domain-containing protein [Lysobacter enzymogenes]UZW60704.1 DUF2783 domain-containing protein [Lysobacter enzymogenes]
MSALNLQPNLARADEVYQRLIELHRGLDEAASRRADARLVLILINHIGDADTVLEAIDVAGRVARPAQEEPA